MSAIEYRLVFEASPALLLVLTPKLEIVGVTDAYLQATMTHRAELVGRGLFDVFPDNPDDPIAAGARNLAASLDRGRRDGVADGMPVQRFDIRRPHATGGGFEQRWWSPVNAPVFGPDGHLAWIVHRVEDVTDLVQREQESAHRPAAAEPRTLRDEQMAAEVLHRDRQVAETSRALKEANAELVRLYESTRAAQAELVAASEYESAFVSNLSHEMRSPLNSIVILSGLLTENRDGNLTAQQQEWASGLTTAGRGLNMLIDDVLDLAKVESGRFSVYVEDVAFGSIVATASSVIAPQAAHARLDYSTEVDSALPWGLRTDERCIAQILRNLLSNACKFTPSGSVRLHVRPIRRDHDELIAFGVIDTGIGIDLNKLDRLFEAFLQADGSITHRFGGTGLGLAISSRMADMLGGRIEVASEQGRGSTFTLLLPFDPVDAPPAPEVAPSSARSDADRLVLVLEDDPSYGRLEVQAAQAAGLRE